MPHAWILGAVLTAAVASPPPPVPSLTRPQLVARLASPVLALAPLGAGRLLVLQDEGLSLWRVGSDTLVREAERPSPALVERVRWPGGLIHAPAGEGGAWALRTGWAEALLVSRDGDAPALALESTAQALPWPGAPNGVRFAPGTNLIQGRVAGLPEGPYLALAPDGSAAVDPEGRLLVGDPRPGVGAPRVGSALVRLGRDWIVASAPIAEAPDALLLLQLTPEPRVVESLEIHGRVRALTVLPHAEGSALFAAVDDDTGAAILRFDVPSLAGAHR